MDVPSDLRYTAEHEWVRMEGDRVVVGITDYAQDALGDIVFVRLPDVGQVLERMDVGAEVESTKSVSEIYAPIAGAVVAVNGALADAPERINAEPYGGGWLYAIVPRDAAEVADLLDAAAYGALVEGA